MKYDHFDPTVISRCVRTKPKTEATFINNASSSGAQDINNEHTAGIQEITPTSEEVVTIELGQSGTAVGQFRHHEGRSAFSANVRKPPSQAEDTILVYNPYEDLLQAQSASAAMACTDYNNNYFNNQSFFSTVLPPINPQVSWMDPFCNNWSPNPSAAECWLRTPPLPYFSNARNTGGDTLIPTNNPFMLFPPASELNSTVNNGIYVNNAEAGPFTTNSHEPGRHFMTNPHDSFPYRSENPPAWSVGGLFPIPPVSDFQVGDYHSINQNPYLFNQPLQRLQMFLQENFCTREEAPYEESNCDPSTDSLPTIEHNAYIEENSTEHSNLQLHTQNDIVVEVSIHVGYPRPLEKEEQRLGRLLKVVDRFLVLGSNTLKELKNSIDCRADYHVFDDVSQRFLTDEDLCKYRYPSSFFFIHDTFYIDREPKGSQDITEKIRTWATEREIGETKVADMNTTKLIDLKCRLGAPYLYVHVGSCEHLISFNDIALRDDIHPKGPYPLLFYELNTRRIACAGCKMATSEWVVWNHECTPVPVQYFCESCYNDLNFDVSGKGTFNFKAAPLYDRHNRKTDFVEREHSDAVDNAVPHEEVASKAI